MSLIFRVEGVQDILRRMSHIAPGIQKKYLAAAVGAVSRPHLREVRSLVKRGPTGNLKRSVGVVVERKQKRKRTGQTAVAVLGFRRQGYGSRDDNRGFHSWWIEHGVKDRQSKSGRPLKIPTKVARKYGYFMPLLEKVEKGVYVNAQTGSDFLVLPRVKGFAGTGKFRRWANANLPGIRDALVRQIGTAVDKAIAEQARRDAKKAAR
jgi:hypothetical protein